MCLIRPAQSATRRNATHIVDNPTIGAPRFPETCFTSVHVYHHKSKHRIRIRPSPYLCKNFRIIVVCNLETVSVIETKGGARLGNSQPARSHERASRDPRTVAQIDNSDQIGCGSHIGKTYQENARANEHFKNRYDKLRSHGSVEYTADLHRCPTASSTRHRLLVRAG